MLWTILAWVAFAAMVWYGWSAFALLRAASKQRLNMLWIVGFWQLVSAIGALLLFRSVLGDTLTFGGILGLIIAGSNPVLWTLGGVRNRLLGHGVRVNEVMMLRDR